MRRNRRKWLLAVMFGILLIGGLPRVYGTEYDELLDNGGFEDGLKGWGIWRPSGSAEVKADTQEAYSGGQSLRIDAKETARTDVSRSVAVSPGTHYKISLWIKTEAVVSAAGGAQLRLGFFDQSGTQLGKFSYAGTVSGTAAWREYQLILEAPARAATLKTELFFETGTGTVWFDNVSVRQYCFTDANLLENPGFEQTGETSAGWTGSCPAGWNLGQIQGTPALEAAEDAAAQGSRTLKITADTAAGASIYQDFQVRAGAWYRAGGLVKVSRMDGGAARIRVQFLDHAAVPIQSGDVCTLSETNDWKQVSALLQAPDGAQSARLELIFELGCGTVWFDELTAAETRPAVLQNGGFETVDVSGQNGWKGAPAAWQLFIPAGTPEIETDDSVAAAGERSLRITASPGTRAAVYQDVPVSENSWYTVRGRIKTQEVNRPAGVRLRIQFLDAAGNITGSPYFAGNYTGTTVWQDTEVTVQVPPSGEKLRIECYMESDSGTGWFDEAEVSHPVREERYLSARSDTAVMGRAQVTLQQGESTAFTLEQSPLHGRVLLAADGQWQYVPENGHCGYDSFAIRETSDSGAAAVERRRVFTAPDVRDISAALRAGHPRLIAAEEDFSYIRDSLSDDPYLAEWYGELRRMAEDILPRPAAQYQADASVARTIKSRIETLGLMYRLSGEEKYGKRAVAEMLSAAEFPDWRADSYFLDTAETVWGLAVGYDWLYDLMTEKEREQVRAAICGKGLYPALAAYQTGTEFFVTTDNNWSLVCNGGIGAGALAVAEEEPALAEAVLPYALTVLQNGLGSFGGDGSWEEGPVYWSYGMNYLTYFLASLENSLGTDYGISELESLRSAGTYFMHMNGVRGLFNYADCNEAFIKSPALLYLAKRYGQPELGWIPVEHCRQIRLFDPLYMLFYRPDCAASQPAKLDGIFRPAEAVTMRGAWDDPDAVFVGFKAGRNGRSHGDMDVGSFVMDALGVRWVSDFGQGNYQLPNYYDYSGTRWTYYRKNPEGHNTLVLNPSVQPEQSKDAVTKITAADSDADGAYAIADLTDAYRSQAQKVRRGIRLLHQRSEVLIQDEIQCSTPADLYWFLHTPAEVSVAGDGTSAVLTQGDKRLWVKLLSGSGAVMSAGPAEPLPGSPNPAGQYSNDGYTTLTIHLKQVTKTNLCVWLVPLRPGEVYPTARPAVQSLDSWSLERFRLLETALVQEDGSPVDAGVFETGGRVRAEAVFLNDSGVGRETCVILAREEGAVLADSKTIRGTVPDGEQPSRLVTPWLTIPPGSDSSSLRAFVWDGLERLRPLGEVLEVP